MNIPILGQVLYWTEGTRYSFREGCGVRVGGWGVSVKIVDKIKMLKNKMKKMYFHIKKYLY